MSLVILGFILFLVALSLAKMGEPQKRFSGPLRILGFAVIAVGMLMSSVVQIDAGQVGVKKLFGKVQTDV